MSTTISWKKHSVVLEEGLNYIEKRKNGEIKSLKTAWTKFNQIGYGGLDFGSVLILGSRPGIGKTLLASNISRQLQELNQDQDFSVLHFQFEMLSRNIAAREFAGTTKLPLRYLLSSGDPEFPPLSNADFEKLKDYTRGQQNRKEYIVDTALTVYEMTKVIEAFYDKYKKPFVVTLDHTLLVKRSPNEKTHKETLDNLCSVMVETKKKYPMIWIVLTQLNRDIDDSDRQIPGKLSNYPTDHDIYGSDSFQHGADVVIAYNRPAKYSLKWYGPDKYIIDDKNLIAAHVIKAREGTPSIIWFKADYSTMTFNEIPEPPKKQVTYGESGN